MFIHEFNFTTNISAAVLRFGGKKKESETEVKLEMNVIKVRFSSFSI